MAPTLTFIYNEVKGLTKDNQVLVICTEHLMKDEFPFPDVVVIPFKQNVIQRKFLWQAEKWKLLLSRRNSIFRKQLLTVIADYKPDIIHGHFGYESMKLLDNLAIDKKVPKFISFHGYDASQMLKRKLYVKKLNKYISYHGMVPICVSGFLRDNLIKANVDMATSELLYFGINTDFFTPQVAQLAENKFTFLQISSFNEKKGHIYTLLAFKLFLENIENKEHFKLVLAGGWGLFEQIKQQCENLGLTKFVEFPGPIDHEQSRRLLSQADAFVHHSITAKNGDTEGMPNAIIEAMAMELPILSTLHAGIPELVEDGVNGYLVNEKDVEQYARRMIDIVRWKHAPQNREKVLDRFSNEVHREVLMSIYRRYL